MEAGAKELGISRSTLLEAHVAVALVSDDCSQSRAVEADEDLVLTVGHIGGLDPSLRLYGGLEQEDAVSREHEDRVQVL
ncbi:hypothetical protein D1825_12705 [Cellulomonas rhizosphaerae]|uniref:Uncharacterized protein n=1 Tax=Cellulomonas rhizosphaerae TaxID=2293719 RepID=A0A413RJY7_9CELL|nr:hypothetical protein D1825_12705 [Cellulomonas rhizosphaerae]